MVQSSATTVSAYLSTLEPERRRIIASVRKALRSHIPKGYVETMNWGMICYEIPLRRHPDTYNGKPLLYVALAAQKNNFALYLRCGYGDASLMTWLRNAYAKAGLKLDMGQSCVRFKRLEDLPLDAIGELVGRVSVDEFIRRHEKVKKKSA